MGLNGVTDSVSGYNSTKSDTANKTAEKTTAEKTSGTKTAAYDTYTPSKETETDSSKKIYKQDTALVSKLKAESESRTQSLRNLVEKLLVKQGEKFNNSTDMYKLLREGKLNVDAATAKQAQDDISENGYWGVNQTSDRILSFAKALTGGDPSKIESMKNAFIKGFEDAKKAWGGELPDISQRTYDAVIKKFDEWKGGGKTDSSDMADQAAKQLNGQAATSTLDV